MPAGRPLGRGLRRVVAAGGTALLLAALWLTSRRAAPPDPHRSPGPISPPRTAETAAALPAAPECYLGVVVPDHAVDVVAEVEGRLKGPVARVGDAVEAGQLVAAIDAPDLASELRSARVELARARVQKRRAELELEQARLEHRRRIALAGLVSSEEIEAAHTREAAAVLAVEAAGLEILRVEAGVARLQSSVSRTSVRAPFSGIVAARYLDPGAAARAGTPIVRLLGGSGQRVRFAVPPDEANQVPPQSAVRVEVDGLRVVLDSRVEQHAPEVDPACGLVFVEARLIEGAPAVPAGAAARVSRLYEGRSVPSCSPGRAEYSADPKRTP